MQHCLIQFFGFQEEYKEAFLLIKDLEPSVPQEYILKGVVNVAIGQESGSVSKNVNMYSQMHSFHTIIREVLSV